jgi:hypothetical protein
VGDFLSSEWFDSLNETLRAAGSPPLDRDAAVFRVVLEFSDAPSSLPHALTFTLTPDGASVDPGDHLAADTLIRLTYADALALTSGSFDSATALREGRIKVRGDFNAVVPLLSWLQRAHPLFER